MDELKSFPIDPLDPIKLLQVGKVLSPEIKEKLKDFLRRKLNVFTWR